MALLEEAVGIRCWTDKLPGFSGILKQRCAAPGRSATLHTGPPHLAREGLPHLISGRHGAAVPLRSTRGVQSCVHLTAAEQWRGVASANERRGGGTRRYCDFLVNEVDTSGHVVRLTSLQPLALPKPEPQPADSPAAQSGGENAGEGVQSTLAASGLELHYNRGY